MTDPLTGQAEAALIRLYEQAKRTTDSFDMERIDRALDEVVRLNSSSPPEQQVRSAMANAYKVIRDRRRIVSLESIEAVQIDIAPTNWAEEVIDLWEWLRGTPHVTTSQRNLLMLVTDDHEPADLAAHYRIPVARMREQISRARRAARTAYHDDMNAA
jgi:hypothetical protein